MSYSKRVHCPKCGVEFAAGFPDNTRGQEVEVLFCPDCGWVGDGEIPEWAKGRTIRGKGGRMEEKWKHFDQYVQYLYLVSSGKTPVVFGPGYVVMTTKHYDDLINRTKIITVSIDEVKG